MTIGLHRFNEATPHFSTVSCNFRHRFTEETVDKIFHWILDEIAEAGYLKPEAVFINGTHTKANANTKKKIAVLTAILSLPAVFYLLSGLWLYRNSPDRKYPLGGNSPLKIEFGLLISGYGYRNFARFRNRILHIFHHKHFAIEKVAA